MKNGFTFIELFITLTIIIIMTATAIPSYRIYQKNAALVDSALEIKGLILKTKTLALAPARDKTPGVDKYCIQFVQGSNEVQITEEGSLIINRKNLSKNVNISVLYPHTNGLLKICYSISEQGKITVDPLATNDINISLYHSELKTTKTVKINPITGLIEIQT